MENNANHTVDFTKPFIKNSLKYVYPLFIFLFACVMLGGVGGNFAILLTVSRSMAIISILLQYKRHKWAHEDADMWLRGQFCT